MALPPPDQPSPQHTSLDSLDIATVVNTLYNGPGGFSTALDTLRELDRNHDGRLNAADDKVAPDMGSIAVCSDVDLDKAQAAVKDVVQRFVTFFDGNGDGRLDRNEFTHLIDALDKITKQQPGAPSFLTLGAQHIPPLIGPAKECYGSLSNADISAFYEHYFSAGLPAGAKLGPSPQR